MRKQVIISLFFLALAVNIIAAESGNQVLQYFSKPLLMPLLMIWFLSDTIPGATLKKWILFALFFSWAGDVLLMFQDRLSDFFLFGLSAFLLAHVFYIVFFHSIRVREGIRGQPLLLAPVVLYYAGLMIWLTPWLGEMRMPVRIYGLIISFMLMLALHMIYTRNRKAAKPLITGAVLFVLSDTLLAVDKFYQHFTGAGILIMVTYGLAQYLLVTGAIKYINAAKK